MHIDAYCIYTQSPLLNLANPTIPVACGELSKNGKVQGRSSVLRKKPPPPSELAKCQVSHSQIGVSLEHVQLKTTKPSHE